MTWQQNTISTLADIPPLVKTFATSVGFTVGGTTSAPTLRAGSGATFALTRLYVAPYDELFWACTDTSAITSTARIRSPVTDAGTAQPTKVIMYAGLTPAPYFAIVVEYGYNRYRHLYMGNLVPASSFTGGEVIAGANFHQSNSGYDFPLSYRDTRHQYLFSGHQSYWANADCGGVRIVHANNPNPWRRFRAGSLSFGGWNAFDGNEVIGGFTDDVNDGYLARGRSSYAGTGILVPVDLYATKGSGSGTQFAQLGHPAGVRMINMTDFDPDSTLTIGGTDEWQVFPAFKKSSSLTVLRGATWGADESSGMVGYAYKR
jgi:hypothetical protein